jgi:hypothetical protein
MNLKNALCVISLISLCSSLHAQAVKEGNQSKTIPILPMPVGAAIAPTNPNIVDITPQVEPHRTLGHQLASEAADSTRVIPVFTPMEFGGAKMSSGASGLVFGSSLKSEASTEEFGSGSSFPIGVEPTYTSPFDPPPAQILPNQSSAQPSKKVREESRLPAPGK